MLSKIKDKYFKVILKTKPNFSPYVQNLYFLRPNTPFPILPAKFTFTASHTQVFLFFTFVASLQAWA